MFTWAHCSQPNKPQPIDHNHYIGGWGARVCVCVCARDPHDFSIIAQIARFNSYILLLDGRTMCSRVLDPADARARVCVRTPPSAQRATRQ